MATCCHVWPTSRPPRRGRCRPVGAVGAIDRAQPLRGPWSPRSTGDATPGSSGGASSTEGTPSAVPASDRFPKDRDSPAASPRRAGRRRSRPAAATFGDYVSLTKPRIIELLLVTTFPVMFLAQRGVPPLGLDPGHPASAARCRPASANILNCYLDRDIDRLMHRTENRPLVTGVISPRRALAFGIVARRSPRCSCSGWPSTGCPRRCRWARSPCTSSSTRSCSSAARRRTSSGAAPPGCMPVLIGWAAVTDSLAWAPVVLFLVVFFWTPPHYWPLSMRFKDDYAAAGVPMLPVVAQDAAGGPPDRGLRLGDGRRVARADPRRADGMALRRGQRGLGRGVPAGGLPAARPGEGPGQHDARVAEARCGCSTSRSAT